MAGWLLRCFNGPGEAGKAYGEPPTHASRQAAERSSVSRNVLYQAEIVAPDALLAIGEEQVATLEQARHVIARLKARLRELDAPTTVRELDATEYGIGIMNSTLASLPAHPSQTADTLSGRKGSEAGTDPVLPFEQDPVLADGVKTANVLHPFRVYDKQELVRVLRDSGKPAAAILLQAVCEEDNNLPAALLLDVDPAIAESMSGTPELAAAMQGGQLWRHAALPVYLRLRLHMLQARAARPILAHANAAARTLFEVRSDRQLQLVLEAQLMHDAMLGMLLQELLDELLTAPVVHGSFAEEGGTGSALMLHSVTHFVNTSNTKVFPFVPVSMRGCGYKKTSGEVVPCIVMHFAPDSNQGAFLEHLQRDYTMMGRMSAIVTLFTLKGDVLHQNAGSIAYYGYQRSGALQLKDNEKRPRGRPHASGRLANRSAGHTAGGSADPKDLPILHRLFQYAPSDHMESMLESMVQGSVWKSILPVPSIITSGGRAHALAPMLAQNPDPIFTADVNLYTTANIESFTSAVRGSDRGGDAAFEGSFGIARNSSKTVIGGPSDVLGYASRALKVVPEQGMVDERSSVSLNHGRHAARVVVASEAGGVQVQVASQPEQTAAKQLEGSLSPRPGSRSGKPLRRSTTYSFIPFPNAMDGGRPCNSAVAGVGASLLSSTAGSGGGSQARFARMRQRSGFNDKLGDALSQSTWGLLGSSACDPRPVAKDSAAEQGEVYARRASSAVVRQLLTSSLATEAQHAPSTDRDGASAARPSSGSNANALSQPSPAASSSQTMWPLQHSQWQAAMLPAPAVSQKPAAQTVVRQPSSQSPVSGSPRHQSSLAAAAGAPLGSRAQVVAALEPLSASQHRASELRKRVSAVLCADGDPSIRGPSGDNPSTGSLVSPQPSTGQYIGQYGTWSTSNGPLSGSRLVGAPAGASLVAAMRLHPAAVGSAAESLRQPDGNTSSRLSGTSQAAQGTEPQPETSGGGAASLSGAHALAGATNSVSRFRRAPMRQSDRSNPNLQLTSVQGPCMASVRSPVNLTSTSFSFGSRGPSQRPLVRMMSYMNVPPGHQLSQLSNHGSSAPHTGAMDKVTRTGSGREVAEGLQGSVLHSGTAVSVRQHSLRHASSALMCSPSEPGESSQGLSTVATHGLPPAMATAAAGEEERLYHEVTATPFVDPVSKSQAVMVVQTDVTARVRLERRLAEVMEAEHKLLENIFPRHVLEHIAVSTATNPGTASQFNLQMLSAMPDPTKTATDHEQVTVLFADIVGFTTMCKEVPAKAVMKFLNDLYTRFDTLLDIYGVYKVETIGDCYMIAGGLISKDEDGFVSVRTGSNDVLQAWRVVSFAKAMLRDAQKVKLPTTNEPVKMRVGIHSGPVVSGIVGTRMPRFCLFGDSINTASRMESTCPHGRIQVSAATHALVPDDDWEATGGVEVKGKGKMETYLLRSSATELFNALAAASLSARGGEFEQPAIAGRARRKHGASIAGTTATPLSSGVDLRIDPLPAILTPLSLDSKPDGPEVSAAVEVAGATSSQANGSDRRSSSGKPGSFLFNMVR